MRIGSRVVPLPVIGGAAAAVIAIIAVIVVVLATSGGDDNGDNNNEQSSSNRTAVSQSRTKVPLTSTAIASARETAVAQGTPRAAFDAANPTPAVPTESAGSTPDTGTTPAPGTTPNTPLPVETSTAAPTPTNVAPGVIVNVTMDANRGSPDIQHNEVTAGAGSTFEIGIDVHDPPGAYQGYQYAITWEDNGVLEFVGEQAAQPQGLTLCSEPTNDPWPDARAGVYGGCLSTEDNVSFTGEVSVVTIRCASAGRASLRMVADSPSEPFSSTLIGSGGQIIPSQVDNGFDVVCS
jgi:hypothetical protein